MSTERSLAERVLDLAVYGPIGLAARVREQHEANVAAGRERFEQTVNVARFVGKMAVDQGQRELRKRFDRSTPESRASAAPDGGAATAATSGPLGDGPVEPEGDVLVTGIVVVPPSAGDALPLADYDSLAASQVVSRLGDLGPDEVEAVRVYEAAHRSRRTILAKIAHLQGT